MNFNGEAARLREYVICRRKEPVERITRELQHGFALDEHAAIPATKVNVEGIASRRRNIDETGPDDLVSLDRPENAGRESIVEEKVGVTPLKRELGLSFDDRIITSIQPPVVGHAF